MIELIKDIISEANRRGRDPGHRPNKLTYDDVWQNKKRIEDYLKMLFVVTEVNGVKRSRQAVNGIVKDSAKRDYFDIDGKQISVFQYFKDVKKYTIQNPDLPCLWIGPRTKQNHVPLEVSI